MRQLITCSIGEHRLAVDVRHVREVIRRPRITPVPSGPAHIAGLINLRGRVLAVFDMAQCLAVRESDQNGQTFILIMRASNEISSATGGGGALLEPFEQSGLLVDAVGEICSVEETELCPPPANMPIGKVPFVPAVVELEGRLNGVLGLEQFYAWAAQREEG